MEARPRFTVLIPTHRQPDALGFAIDSVLAQTVRDFELLLVLDGVEDATRAVAAKYDDARIRVFDLPKAPGQGHANRQIALQESRGDIVAYQQDDDIWLPDHLERMGPLFSDPGVLWAHSKSFWVTPGGWLLPHCANASRGPARRDLVERANMIASSSVAHRRAALDLAGGWEPSGERGGDGRLWRRMLSLPGDGIARCMRVPTVLHFNSDPSRPPSWPPLLAGFRAMATAGRLPSALKLDGAGDWRAIAWDRIRMEETRFVNRIRIAFEQVQEDVAWAWSTNPLL